MNKPQKKVTIELTPASLASLQWLLLLLVSDNFTPEEKIVACIECLPQIQALLDSLPEPEKGPWLPPKLWHPERKASTKTI